jgi:hypothetical protein
MVVVVSNGSDAFLLEDDAGRHVGWVRAKTIGFSTDGTAVDAALIVHGALGDGAGGVRAAPVMAATDPVDLAG